MATEIDTMREENTGLRQQIGDLERDMAAIKRMLQEAFVKDRDIDFTAEGTPGGERPAGSGANS